MMVTAAAKRYGKALFDLALKNDVLDEIQREFQTLLKLLAENTKFQTLVTNPNVDRRKKIFTEIIQPEFSELFSNFIRLILKNSRYLLLQAIYQDFQERFNTHFNRKRAVVVTSVPMPEHQILALDRELTRRLQADVSVENQVDPAILGGVVLYLDGKAFNASLAEQFKQLKQYLTHNHK